MVPLRLTAAAAIQAVAFLGPLAAAPAGLVSGELAGAAAPLLWFSAGLPLSYRLLDRGRDRLAAGAGSHVVASLPPEARNASGVAQVAPAPAVETA
jgi:hypothetical protein